MIPGINLLHVAATVIQLTKVEYYPCVSRVKDNMGRWVVTYGPMFTIGASVQPIPRSKYAFLDLDFQKKYVKIFVPYNSIDLDRDVAGDQFVFAGEKYTFQNNTEWYDMDGWNSAIAIKVEMAVS
jgi:hypothetical protein